jgi:hypothetical protein
MNEKQLIDTLERLAHSVLRNELVYQHLLSGKLPVSREEIGAKEREIDEHLKENTGWRHNRFPGLFPENSE